MAENGREGRYGWQEFGDIDGRTVWSRPNGTWSWRDNLYPTHVDLLLGMISSLSEKLDGIVERVESLENGD